MLDRKNEKIDQNIIRKLSKQAAEGLENLEIDGKELQDLNYEHSDYMEKDPNSQNDFYRKIYNKIKLRDKSLEKKAEIVEEYSNSINSSNCLNCINCLQGLNCVKTKKGLNGVNFKKEVKLNGLHKHGRSHCEWRAIKEYAQYQNNKKAQKLRRINKLNYFQELSKMNKLLKQDFSPDNKLPNKFEHKNNQESVIPASALNDFYDANVIQSERRYINSQRDKHEYSYFNEYMIENNVSNSNIKDNRIVKKLKKIQNSYASRFPRIKQNNLNKHSQSTTDQDLSKYICKLALCKVNVF